MTRTNIFVTKEELEGVKTQQQCSGMFLSGGQPMGDPFRAVQDLLKKYNQPSNYGMDLRNGEFVSP